MATSLNYNPPGSLVPFFLSTDFASFVVGCYGSGKTTASLMKIAYEASRMAPSTDGIRRSRCVVVRNTRQMLWDTTIKDFLKWFPDGVAGTLRRTESAFDLKFGDVECEVLFRGLDDANDVRRLLSLQLSFGVMDEFKEIHADIYEALAGRVGRYPDKVLVPANPKWGLDEKGNPIGGCVDDQGRQMKRIWAASNPPEADSWWETLLSSPPNNMHVTIQPSGLSPEADWIHLLDAGYYENLAELHAADPDWVDVFIHGKFGKSLQGQPVFRCFDQSRHVAKEGIKVQTGTLLIGVDAGLNPTAVITQQTYDGRVLVLDALTGADGGMGALRFIRERLKPLLLNKYPGRQSVIIIDPAAFQRAQTDERSVADIFKAEGFLVKPARTNSIAARIAAVESFMTRTVDGKSSFLVDPTAKDLIAALRSKYRYKYNTKGERDDKPEKSHPWSDYCFVAGTLVATPDGYRPIQLLEPGDMVTTPRGPNRVLAAACVSDATEVWEYTFSDDSCFVATPDHPVYVEAEKGFVPLDELQYADILISISTEQERAQWQKSRSSGLTESVSPNSRGIIISGTSGASTESNGLRRCIGMFGSITRGRYQTGGLYTTGTMTLPTIISTILNYVSAANTSANTWSLASPLGTPGSMGLPKREKLQKRGTAPKKDGRGTALKLSKTGRLKSAMLKLAHTVVNHMESFVGLRNEASVPPLASLPPEEKAELTTPRATALYAAPSLFATSIQKSRHAVTLVGRRKLPQLAAVFTLQVENEPMYFANGVLVKNCDATQYACLQHDNGGIFGGNALAQRREIKPAPWAWA